MSAVPSKSSSVKNCPFRTILLDGGWSDRRPMERRPGTDSPILRQARRRTSCVRASKSSSGGTGPRFRRRRGRSRASRSAAGNRIVTVRASAIIPCPRRRIICGSFSTNSSLQRSRLLRSRRREDRFPGRQGSSPTRRSTILHGVARKIISSTSRVSSTGDETQQTRRDTHGLRGQLLACRVYRHQPHL